jgi:hypothetical protein
LEQNEHVITTRRPSAGTRWLVIHLESMTQLLAIRTRGALVAAASRAVESSIGSVMSTRPVSGTRPSTGRPAARAAKDAYDRAGPTRQLPTASRGNPAGRN